MKIILSPTACFNQDTPPTVNGELLTYRGVEYDLSQLPEGATVEADLPFIGNITRVNGQVQLTLQYCYHMEKAEDHQSHNWDDYTFVVSNGQCPCPIKFKPDQISSLFRTASGEIDHIKIKTQPFTHTKARDFLNGCVATGIEITWVEGESYFDRLWIISGTSDALGLVAAEARKVFPDWRYS